MSTALERLHDTTLGAVRKQWTALLDRLAAVTPWLAVGLILVTYGVVYAVGLLAAGSAALYLAEVIPGVAGTMVFFTVGLAVIGAVPTAVRRLFVRVVDAIEARAETESSEGSA